MSATFYVSPHTAECSIHTCYHFNYQYVPDYLIASLVGGVDLSEKGEVDTSYNLLYLLTILQSEKYFNLAKQSISKVKHLLTTYNCCIIIT